MKSRTRARSLALQVLYEVDLTGHLPGVVFAERLEELQLEDQDQLTPELVEFARQIISGVLSLAEKLDQVIASYAPEWPFDQIAAIDRNILRMSTWEFAVSRQTPVKVAINEAVELAKLFGSDNAARFINGVLGSLADHEHELAQQFKKGLELMELLGVGVPELVFIVLIALLLLGPKDMLAAGRTFGRSLRKFIMSPEWEAMRKTGQELQQLPTKLMREANLEELQALQAEVSRTGQQLQQEVKTMTQQIQPPEIKQIFDEKQPLGDPNLADKAVITSEPPATP